MTKGPLKGANTLAEWYVTEGTKVKSLFYEEEIEFPHHASLYALFSRNLMVL